MSNANEQEADLPDVVCIANIDTARKRFYFIATNQETFDKLPTLGLKLDDEHKAFYSVEKNGDDPRYKDIKPPEGQSLLDYFMDKVVGCGVYYGLYQRQDESMSEADAS